MDEVRTRWCWRGKLGRTDAEDVDDACAAGSGVWGARAVTQQERWEEVGGIRLRRLRRRLREWLRLPILRARTARIADAERYMKTADDWAGIYRIWMVTTTGHLGKGRGTGYYIRIETTGSKRIKLDRARGGVWDERDVVDAASGIVRLGIRPAKRFRLSGTRWRSGLARFAWRRRTGVGYRYQPRWLWRKNVFGRTVAGRSIGKNLADFFTGEPREYEIAAAEDRRLP